MVYNNCLIIDLEKLKKNVSEIRRSVGSEVKLCAVVKADAYGLGMAGIVPLFAECAIDLFGVARFCEASELKRIMKDRPGVQDVLIMGLCDDRELEKALLMNMIITLDNYEQAVILSEAAVKHKKTAHVHIKIDTGFGRLGLRASWGLKRDSIGEDSLNIYRRISELPGLEIQGTFSHLALCNAAEDEKQTLLLNDFCHILEREGTGTGFHHICDSIGTVRYPEYRMDMVRTGAILYGMRPFNAPLAQNLDLEFPVTWVSAVSRVIELQEGEGVSYDYSWVAPCGGARIATIPVGYADGFPRNLSRSGQVLIGGVLCPIAGLICMDQMMVDVSAVPIVKRGDQVVLLGKQANKAGQINEISILALAEMAGTNRNEILARIGRRTLRQYYYKKTLKAELAYLDEPSYREYN